MSSPILNVTARKIIESAYRSAGLTPAEQTVTSYEVGRGVEVMNFIIKAWQSQGHHLWSETEAIIPLNVGQQKYLVGPNGDEIATEESFFFTNTEADQVATDTVISVFDASGFVVPESILSFSPTDSTQDWTAINSGLLTSDGTTLNIENGAAADGGGEYTLATTIGEEYIVSFDYTLGTSAGATFSAVSGTTLDTVTLSATSSGELRFVANSDQVTFRAENVSTTLGEDSDLSELSYVGIATGSRVGVQLDSGIREWSFVIAKDEASDPNTITISTPLASDSATSSIVYGYTDKIDRPLRILQARYSDFVTHSEIPTEKWSRSEYFDQPDKQTKGTVVQWYYSPQLSDGELYVWQTASSVNNLLRITYTRPLEITEEILDRPDIPAEWADPIKWAVARDLGVEFGISDGRFNRLQFKAESSLELALSFDVEDSYIVFQPDMGGR